MSKRLKAIYTPKGPAREYAQLALNPYKGCTHRCIYCYNSNRFGPPGHFFKEADPRIDIVEKVRHDCRILRMQYGDDCPEIHLTFLGDAYQPAELVLKITRRIIKLLIQHDLPFTILTKSPHILRDVDLLGPYNQFRVGFSLTSVRQIKVDEWEPGTAKISSRISALQQFHKFNKPVWVSLEPVMDVTEACNVIDTLGSMVDHYWVGALNHFAPPVPINKLHARQMITSALDRNSRDYSFKSSFNFSLD